MKTYRIKNYKGDLVESISNFQKKYPKMRIVEAVETDGSLKVVTEDDNEPDGEYKKCQKKVYSVQIYVPKQGIKVHNKLENSNYETNEKKPFVIIGTVGEEWTVDANKLKKTYLFNNKEITDDVIAEFSDGRKHKITTKKDGVINWCKFIPKNIKCKVETSWGETLEANRNEVPHGNGDYIVTADDHGKPNLEDRWIVNGEIFDKTYKIID